MADTSVEAIARVLALATEHHRAGRLDQAEADYRRVLAAFPDSPAALTGLGVIASQRGDDRAALDLLTRVVAVAPQEGSVQGNLGMVLHRLGRLEEAEAALRRTVALRPADAAAHVRLGRVLVDLGREEEALIPFWRGERLGGVGSVDRAVLGRALNRTMEKVARLLNEQRIDEAEAILRSLLTLWPPATGTIHRLLALVYRSRGRFDEAADLARQATRRSPDDWANWVELARVERERGRLAKAVEAARHAVGLAPDQSAALLMLGICLEESGELAEAERVYAATMQVDPADDNPSWHLALCRAKMGRLAEGLGLYAQIYRRKQEREGDHFVYPRWDGRPIPGGRLLLVADGGYGDMIQGLRFGATIRRMGMSVMLLCPPPLCRLAESTGFFERVIPLTGGAVEVGGADAYAMLHEMIPLFVPTADRIVAEVPYCQADPELRQAWAVWLAAHGAATLRVGVAWSGNPGNPHDHHRSMTVTELAPLAAVPGVKLFAIQRERERDPETRARLGIIDLAPQIDTFADTAAIIANLDLVISVDTAIIHVAAAMAKPTWVMVPRQRADWRWPLDREDTPWYPTLRLFRQPAPGDWRSVVGRVAAELRGLAESRSGAPS